MINEETLEIEVSDTGPDMTKSASFTPEPDSPFKERGKLGGVNFGLAYLIINQHNGQLTYDSYEKGGTTFTIILPVAQKLKLS